MNWWQNAQVGDKVVCIDGDWLKHSENDPKIGDVCEITGVFALRTIHHQGCHVYFHLKGYGIAVGAGYNASCFRPVQPKSTKKAMAALRGHLIPAKQREDA